MQEVELWREEDDIVFAGAGEPGLRGVERRGGVFEAAVVGGRVDDGFLLVGDLLCGGVGNGIARQGEHVEVHLGAEAFWRAGRGDPAGEGDEVVFEGVSSWS